MTTNLFRGLVGPRHSATELAKRADGIVDILRDLPSGEAALVLRVALELATREPPEPRTESCLLLTRRRPRL